MIRVALRADASPSLGSGHVMRALMLADALKARGAEAVLLTSGLPARLAERARAARHEVVEVPLPESSSLGREQQDAEQCRRALDRLGGADRLIVDHYGLGAVWEAALAEDVPWIAVVDDLADRAHLCDVLLDHNLQKHSDAYDRLVPRSTRQLLGPRYALLREEFAQAKRTRGWRDDEPLGVLVSLGGGDSRGMVLRVVESLNRVSLSRRLWAVVGDAEESLSALRRIADDAPGVEVLVDCTHIARLMTEAGIAVGAGGISTWERCYLGLPTVCVVMADNQVASTQAVAALGAVVDLGADPSGDAIARAVRSLVSDSERRRELSRAGLAMMRGARPGRRHELAMRCMAGSGPTLRPLRESDEARLFTWRTSPGVALGMSTTGPSTRAEHAAWFAATLRDRTREYFILERSGRPVGVIHLDRDARDRGAAEWGFYVEDAEQGRGIGKTLCTLGLVEAFVAEDLRVVRGRALEGNERSIRLHERLGFVRAGQDLEEGGAGPNRVIRYELERSRWMAQRGEEW